MSNPSRGADDGETGATNPVDSDLEAQLAAAHARIRLLEAALATKQREVFDIHRSGAWRLVGWLRSQKLRLVDPLLDVLGLRWPRVAESLSPAAQPEMVQAGGRYDIVCLSTCAWDERFQRPQQLMARYAAAGHRVFYVRQQLRGGDLPWTGAIKRPNVCEVTLRDETLEAMTALVRDMSIGRAILYVQTPSWSPFAKMLRSELGWPLVYDCMDLHAGFINTRRSVIAHEEELLAEADLVVVSSSALERRALEYRREVSIVRNGCDYEHFASTPRANNARPVIGYYGAIADWFDAALVASLAKKRTDWDLVLVGSTYAGAISELARLPNVSLPGEQAYESLPDWLGTFDVCIIAFRRMPLTEATNPVKVYEMLAAGKPVVSVPIPEVAALAPLVRLASSDEELEREIEAALTDDPADIEARRAFAREQTWDRRFAQLVELTDEVMSSYLVAR